MAVQSGKDLLIKIDQTGDGQFVTIAGLRTQRLALNAHVPKELMDVLQG
ncbi:MAG: phage tail tube protein, partial [Pseudomonadota bacterium]